jgi:hypothetical protein
MSGGGVDRRQEMENDPMGTHGSERELTGPRRRWLAMAVAAATGMLAVGALSPPALAASGDVTGFEVTTTTDQAGGHPDLGMTFELEDPGQPKSARNVIVNTPEGLFGNPNAIPQCNSEDFGFQRCSTASQEGVITVYANY